MALKGRRWKVKGHKGSEVKTHPGPFTHLGIIRIISVGGASSELGQERAGWSWWHWVGLVKEMDKYFQKMFEREENTDPSTVKYVYYNIIVACSQVKKAFKRVRMYIFCPVTHKEYSGTDLCSVTFTQLAQANWLFAMKNENSIWSLNCLTIQLCVSGNQCANLPDSLPLPD